MKRIFTFNQRKSYNHLITEKEKNDPQSGPSDKVLQNILNYSKALSVLKTSYTGDSFMILN